jgi:hypothetical protein
MMKAIRVLAGCALALSVAVPAMARTDFHVSLNLGTAPPAPVVYVHRAPRTVWLPQYQVSVVNDPYYMNGEDSFHVGAYWYVYDDGYWYRARSWRGPFAVISDRYVPTTLARVPARHWRHERWTGPNVRNADFFQRHNYRRWRANDGRWHYDHAHRGRGNDRGDRGRGNDRGRGHGR